MISYPKTWIHLINFTPVAVHEVQTVNPARAAHGDNEDDDGTAVELGQHWETGGNVGHFVVDQQQVH